MVSDITIIVISLFATAYVVGLALKKYKLLMYITEWIVPSSTAVYVVLHEYQGWDIISAYLVACMVGAIIYYPVNKYIFKKCDQFTIYINGVELKVKDKSFVLASDNGFEVTR